MAMANFKTRSDGLRKTQLTCFLRRSERAFRRYYVLLTEVILRLVYIISEMLNFIQIFG